MPENANQDRISYRCEKCGAVTRRFEREPWLRHCPSCKVENPTQITTKTIPLVHPVKGKTFTIPQRHAVGVLVLDNHSAHFQLDMNGEHPILMYQFGLNTQIYRYVIHPDGETVRL